VQASKSRIGFSVCTPLDVGFDRIPHAQPDRPERPEIVLRLDCAQPGDHITRLLDRGVSDALVMKSQARNVRSRHDLSVEEIAAAFINGI